MKNRNYSQNKSAQKIKHERDPIPWRYCFLTLICGLLLVGGFFFAARQHFAAMDFGIKNSKLKKQLEDLEDEKRRLVLAKEFAISPAEIKKAAKKFGLTNLMKEAGITGDAPLVKNGSLKPDAPTGKPAVETQKVSFSADKPRIDPNQKTAKAADNSETKNLPDDNVRKDFKVVKSVSDKKGNPKEKAAD